jgi:hypothetical protein
MLHHRANSTTGLPGWLHGVLLCAMLRATATATAGVRVYFWGNSGGAEQAFFGGE